MERDFLSEHPGSDESYPALRFERHFGLYNIGVQWKMPNGKTMKEVEHELWNNGVLNHSFDINTVLTPAIAASCPAIEHKFEKAVKLREIFNALNPELKTVKLDTKNWDQLRGFIHGVVSGLNKDDIQGWIDGTLDYELNNNLAEIIIEQYFLPPGESWYPQTLRDEFNEMAQQCTGISRELIAGKHWVASATTIQKIHTQLNEKHNYRPLAYTKLGSSQNYNP